MLGLIKNKLSDTWVQRIYRYIDSGVDSCRAYHSRDFGSVSPGFTEKLATLFANYGSDKSTTHDYCRVYSDILGVF